MVIWGGHDSHCHTNALRKVMLCTYYICTPCIYIIYESGELIRSFKCSNYVVEPSDIAVYGKNTKTWLSIKALRHWHSILQQYQWKINSSFESCNTLSLILLTRMFSSLHHLIVFQILNCTVHMWLQSTLRGCVHNGSNFPSLHRKQRCLFFSERYLCYRQRSTSWRFK